MDGQRVTGEPPSPALQVYLNRRMGELAAVGLASGLPYMLTGTMLQAWMKDAGVSLSAIGLFSLVTLPYTLKFLWAPLMDRYVPPMLGRRRGWLMLTQLALIACITVMAGIGAQSLLLLGLVSLALAFFSASQDIVADAYRTDILREEERGAGAAVFVTGYRLAILLTSSVGLWAVGHFHLPWPVVYLSVAGALGACLIVTLHAPEPPAVAEPPVDLLQAFTAPLLDLLLRRRGWLILLFVLLFKLPDVVVEGMRIPFLMEAGFSKQQIGLIGQGLGLGLSIAGAVAGGLFVARLGLWHSLWVVGVLQALSNLGFWLVTQRPPTLLLLATVIGVENFCAGLVTAGFVAFLMSQCDRRFSATQFALLSSLMAVTRAIGGAPAGYLVEHLGWRGFFLHSIVLAVPALLLLPWLRRATLPPALEPAFPVLLE